MIEPVSEKNIEEVLPLIREYQKFYKVTDISDIKNHKFFSQFGEGEPHGCQFMKRSDGAAVGFSTVYFSFASSITSKVGVLNDLYVLPSERGKGIGRELIKFSKSYARKMGAARLQWLTAEDNESAQRLYDSMGVKKSSWYFYGYNT